MMSSLTPPLILDMDRLMLAELAGDSERVVNTQQVP